MASEKKKSVFVCRIRYHGVADNYVITSSPPRFMACATGPECCWWPENELACLCAPGVHAATNWRLEPGEWFELELPD